VLWIKTIDQLIFAGKKLLYAYTYDDGGNIYKNKSVYRMLVVNKLCTGKTFTGAVLSLSQLTNHKKSPLTAANVTFLHSLGFIVRRQK